jgi:lysophospholipase L1-like esterase
MKRKISRRLWAAMRIHDHNQERRARLAGAQQATHNIVAANRTVTPGSISSPLTGGLTPPFTYRTEHWASPEGTVSDIQFLDVGWYYYDNGTVIAETAIGGTFTFKRYIEYPAGVFTPVMYNGNQLATVPDGGQVKSDAVAALQIPPATRFWVRTVFTGATGANVIPLSAIAAAATTLGITDGFSAGDLGNSGTVAVSSSVSDQYKPAAIVGTIAKANATAHVFVGDSITAIGQGDTFSVGVQGGSGWLARALDPLYPYTRIGRQAISAKDIAAANTKLRALIAAISYTHVGIGLGTNDFNTRNNRSAAQCLTDCGTIMGLFPNTGVTKYQATLGGNASSTDGFKSAGNQTANATQAAQIPTFNPAVRAKQAYLNGGFVVEYGNATVPVTDNCKWRTPYVMTLDGTHPNTYAHAWVANYLRPTFGGSYIAEPETTAFFNTSIATGDPAPSQAWLDNYNSLVLSAKVDGWWNSVSKIHLYKGYDRGVSKRNIKRNGDHQVEVGTLGWTAKVGFQTLGTGKLTSPYNPATAPDGLFTQNSASVVIGVASNEAVTNGATDISYWNGSAGVFFTTRNGSNVAQGRLNSAGNQATGATVTDSTGIWVFDRTASTTTTVDKDGANLVTNNSASVAVASATEEVGGLGSTYTNKTLSCMAVGTGLSAAQRAAIRWDLASFNSVAATL